MKKLIMTVAIVCAAVVAQAATANWKMAASNIYSGNTTDKYTGTAYVFDSSLMGQSALFAMIEAGTTTFDSSTTGFITTATVNNGVIAANTTQFGYGEQSTTESKNNYSFYFVIAEDDAAYFSNIVAKDANGTATAATITMGSQISSQLAAVDGFQGAGKWSAVPEPTSGLLMLLGMAGLALKRKRA